MTQRKSLVYSLLRIGVCLLAILREMATELHRPRIGRGITGIANHDSFVLQYDRTTPKGNQYDRIGKVYIAKNCEIPVGISFAIWNVKRISMQQSLNYVWPYQNMII
jgi:hypothetical protein